MVMQVVRMAVVEKEGSRAVVRSLGNATRATNDGTVSRGRRTPATRASLGASPTRGQVAPLHVTSAVDQVIMQATAVRMRSIASYIKSQSANKWIRPNTTVGGLVQAGKSRS